MQLWIRLNKEIIKETLMDFHQGMLRQFLFLRVLVLLGFVLSS